MKLGFEVSNYCILTPLLIPYKGMPDSNDTAQPKATVVHLPVRDFAMPVPRIGSIEVNSGYGLLPGGQEIHTRIQKERKSTSSVYKSEQKLSIKFTREEFQFVVGGRLDGIFHDSPPVIEEIKSTLNTTQLRARLEEQTNHPYLLQIRTYGYIYKATTQVNPKLQLHLASISSPTDRFNFDVDLDLESYQRWLDLRLDELVLETRRRQATIARRKQIATIVNFPFDQPRQGQREMIEWIENNLGDEAQLLIQAPTGLGKTVGVMYPMLKDSLSRGQKLVYVTPKNSQHSVAEDAIERIRSRVGTVKSTTLNAKSKLCFKPEPICNPDYCEYARDYYSKTYNGKVIELLDAQVHLNADVFMDFGRKFEVCPFELSIDSLRERDVIIGDYNYVFSPRSLLSRLTEETGTTGEKPNLVVDEAHNLPSRACDYYSPELSSSVLKDAVKHVRTLSPGYAIEGEAAFNRAISVLDSARVSNGKEAAVVPDRFAFQLVDQSLREFLSRYMNSGLEIERRDPVILACQSWSQFNEGLSNEGEQFFATFRSTAQSDVFKITCCDASGQLEQAYREFSSVVAFSATIKPFDYYSRLSGFSADKLKLAEFQSPFPAENRKVLIIPQVSTKYTDRKNNYSKIADAISRITAVRPGNYFVFFPSFEFLEQVLALTATGEFNIMAQKPDMKSSEVQGWLECLRETNSKTLIFAVQGGTLSEGIDYPGDTIIGALIVGPALPKYNLERELIRRYYDKVYMSGFDYAYTFPAMTRVVQAAGRVIRSEKDVGLIVLLDKRFLEQNYAKAMPREWFADSVGELVSTSIIRDVNEFWQSRACADQTETAESR